MAVAKIVRHTGPGAIRRKSAVSPAKMPANGASNRTRQVLREANKPRSPMIPPIVPATAMYRFIAAEHSRCGRAVDRPKFLRSLL